MKPPYMYIHSVHTGGFLKDGFSPVSCQQADLPKITDLAQASWIVNTDRSNIEGVYLVACGSLIRL